MSTVQLPMYRSVANYVSGARSGNLFKDGWKEFKSNYISTLWVGFAVGAIVVIYKTFLGVFNAFGTEMYEMYYRLEIFVYYCRCFHMCCCYMHIYI